MAYYDRVVRDPAGAFAEVARRRNLSPEQLEERLEGMLTSAASGAHLTLGEARSFFDDGAPPSAGVITHVEGCGYCKSMIDALSPAAVDNGLKRLIVALESQTPPVEATASDVSANARRRGKLSRQGSWPLGLAIAATALLTLSIVPNPIAPWFPDHEAEVADARRENAALRAQLLETELEQLREPAGRGSSVVALTTPSSSRVASTSTERASEPALPLREPQPQLSEWSSTDELAIQTFALANASWIVEDAKEGPGGETEITLRQVKTPQPEEMGRVPSAGESVYVLNPAHDALAVVRDAAKSDAGDQ